jgi:hypothetical protein
VSAAPHERSRPAGGDGGAIRKPSRRELRLCTRALSHLNKAIDEAGAQLSRAWVVDDGRGDPDLKSLRADPDWQLVENRFGSGEDKLPQQSSKRQLGDYKAQLPDRYPDRPWGRPAVRQAVWLILTVLFAAIAVALGIVLLIAPHAFGVAWLVLVALVAVFNFWQLLKAHREALLVGDDRARFATSASLSPRRPR